MTTSRTIVKLTTDIQRLMPDAIAARVYSSVGTGSKHAESDISTAVLPPPTNKRLTSWLPRTEAQALAEQWHEKVGLVNF